MFDLTGKRALVTGSTQGIGYAVAKVLTEHGANVSVHCSRGAEKAERIRADRVRSAPSPAISALK